MEKGNERIGEKEKKRKETEDGHVGRIFFNKTIDRYNTFRDGFDLKEYIME